MAHHGAAYPLLYDSIYTTSYSSLMDRFQQSIIPCCPSSPPMAPPPPPLNETDLLKNIHQSSHQLNHNSNHINSIGQSLLGPTFINHYLNYPSPMINSCLQCETTSFINGFPKQIRYVSSKSSESSRMVENPFVQTVQIYQRKRTVFTENQRKQLEKCFQENKYIGKAERQNLAKKIGLEDEQVKVWFINRRTKWRNSGKKKKSEGGKE